MTIIIVSIIVFTAIAIYAFLGGFRKVKFQIEMSGGETIVYKDVSGDYRQTPSVTNEVYNYLLNELKIETNKGIGIFYDNPKKVKEKVKTNESVIGYIMRSESGCVIEPKDTIRLSSMQCKYKIKTLPAQKTLITEFPYKGSSSLLMAMFKIYPALEKYTKVHNLKDSPIIEIYDVPNKKIIYRKLIE
ncbi:Uncharacterised protein [Bacteroides thetaiotaomicron]|nr:Uncharacterised protein [Bacteroides thetaiotaomicron]